MRQIIEIESQSQKRPWRRVVVAAAILVFSLAASARLVSAQADAPSNEELARRIEALAAELDDMEHGAVTLELASRHGFGPAASKVYGVDRGFSFGGYGEMVYVNDDDQPAQIDFLRQILYVGYKFDDHILFNAELEFEHASTGKSGEVSVEFAQIDFLLTPEFNARAGLLLVPMGFINELHEPPIFLGVNRPVVERVIIPTTWRANGVGVFGDGRGSVDGLQYRAYLIESLVSSGFTANGLRSGRQSGSKALAEDFAGVLRADYERNGVRVGGSAFFGNTSQGVPVEIDNQLQSYGAFTAIYEGHAQFRHRGLQLRGLVTRADVSDAELINAANGIPADDPADPMTARRSVGSTLVGWYLELGWDVLTLLRPGSRFALTPYVRYSELNTQHEVPSGFLSDPANDERLTTLGLAFHPHSQVVLKGDYIARSNDADTGTDQWNLGLGYLF